MSFYANTLNENFVEVSNQLKEKGFKHFKKLLKVNNPEFTNYVIGTNDELDVLTEVKNNLWFFVRELLVDNDNGENSFSWETFVTLDLLNSGTSSIIVNDDNALAMYLKWNRYSGKNPLVICEDLNAINLELHKVRIDDSITDSIGLGKNDRYISSTLSHDVSNEDHVIVYAKELTNEILSFYFVNRDKTRITIVVDSDYLIYSDDVIIESLDEKFNEEFYIFVPEDYHRQLMYKEGLYVDLTWY